VKKMIITCQQKRPISKWLAKLFHQAVEKNCDGWRERERERERERISANWPQQIPLLSLIRKNFVEF
jgi:hypothetical protein